MKKNKKTIKISNKKNMVDLLNIEIINTRELLQSLLIVKWTIENKLKDI